MSGELSVEEVTALLLDEHRSEYNNSIPPKALHKILYFASQELKKEHVAADLSIYWYMYGAVVRTNNTGIGAVDTQAGQRVTCDMQVNEITAGDATIRRARRALEKILNLYYSIGLEPLTDKMYNEAPHDVQRTYRELDKQLDVAADDGQMTLFGKRNEERTRETLYDFIENFPVDEFPEYEDDLYIWYRLVSAEIDSDDYDPNRAQRLSGKFWRLFCLELSCRENTGLSRVEIAAELNVQSIDAVKESIRSDFLNLERGKARQNARTNETAVKAAEAFVTPLLDFDVAI